MSAFGHGLRELLVIAAGTGFLALCGSRYDLVAIVCVLLLVRFRGRVHAVIAAAVFSVVTIAIGHRFSQRFTRNGEVAIAIGAIWCCVLFAMSSKSSRTPASNVTNPFDIRLDEVTISLYDIHTDINSLKEIENELQKREHQLRGIVETIPSMLWTASPSGEVVYINQRLREYSGFSLEDFGNLGWGKFLHPEDIAESAKAFYRSIQIGESYSAIHRLRRADGEYRWHHARAEPLRDPEGKIIQWYGQSIDIDERKRAEDQLRLIRGKPNRASRIATVAELSASIAHELNQPLMAVLANAQATKR